MTDTKSTAKSAGVGPVEIWLSKANIEITCTMVREDETTEPLKVNSLSMRGAQREITGWLMEQGYDPAGRWDIEADHGRGEVTECVRLFKPGVGAEPM